MIKTMEEMHKKVEEILEDNKEELKEKGFTEEDLLKKIDLKYVGIHSELKRMKNILNNKENLLAFESELYCQLSDILCYSDKATREMRASLNKKIERTMRHWTNHLTENYANKISEFKNKLPFPTIFNKEFRDSDLFVEYYSEEGGETNPRTFNLCRKFETTIKRSVSYEGEMMRNIPTEYQVKIKCYIQAKLDRDYNPVQFFLVEKNGWGVISYHSSSNGGICLGNLTDRGFLTNFKNAVKNLNWKKVNEMFDQIEKLFCTANPSDPNCTYNDFKERTSSYYKKLKTLWKYLSPNEIDDENEEEEY